MKIKYAFCFVVIVLLVGCSEKKRPIKGDTEFQRTLNAEFKDATTSPLKVKDRKQFDGLNFFKFDSTYVVNAKFVRTPDELPFKMKTTTNRLPEYVKYGELHFQIKGESFKLNVYQDESLKQEKGYDDYLFLPFLDETSGFESYGGGRYLDVSIPKGNELVIDFNKSYNPYCAYNDKYSCPVVPRENYLKTKIEAGVKAFKKN
ncbi:DUF1684 domain-containing protein [Tamlana fucoidanivorans]|uniref:DUF1684 domain-containing protein n=1 Tax=Allotamlana fucoidanivorans TaxID=2583814 RepID=A0A5C4SHN6_9FLAO|nr:DUF1684 domain-containing protein [Tamlana fucoidanivorans]TNJ42862.1 DUF1684 domain-containing protein [Tamlana fucoidanivorans]